MNKFDYKNLTPFKWFVLENFPFIEADFDALTEWGLFCKLGKEINKIINSQNLLGKETEKISEAFIQLQNYFLNINIEEEVNNKLNQMAQDGTLSNILVDYIQNINLYAPSLETSLGSESIALLMDFKNAILFDTGRQTSAEYNKNYFLTKLGDRKINAVIISHYHNDHIGGIKDLKDLYSENCTIYLPLDFTNYYNGTDDIAQIIAIRQDVINWLIANNINFVEVNTDLLLNFDTFTIQLYNSTPQAYNYYKSIEAPKYNSYSMNALVKINNNKIYFPRR